MFVAQTQTVDCEDCGAKIPFSEYYKLRENEIFHGEKPIAIREMTFPRNLSILYKKYTCVACRVTFADESPAAILKNGFCCPTCFSQEAKTNG